MGGGNIYQPATLTFSTFAMIQPNLATIISKVSTGVRELLEEMQAEWKESIDIDNLGNKIRGLSPVVLPILTL